ncbi:MAG: hypothetical protein MI919_23170 [Holophagales bacterium]|nr:hypothetical protein [Holophagales bacterium]
MPEPKLLQKAQLQEIRWNAGQEVEEVTRPFTVQLNPETLKVSFSTQSSGGDQRGGGAKQFLGNGTTKLSFELWFDVSAPQPDGDSFDDVRRLTKKVVDLITPKEKDGKKWVPPGVRVLWGTFLFEGVLDSVNENLELFSEEGKPLRANVSLSLSKQEIEFRFGNQAPTQAPGAGAAGTGPLEPARDGDTIQDVAARGGHGDDWQGVAEANDIDNPRRLEPGTPIDNRAA